MGTATAWSARATRSAGSPHASLPNSQAVGRPSAPSDSSSSSSRPALPSAARICRPAPRSAAAACRSGDPATTGRWNRLPAEARTHLLLYGSTEASEKTTPSAPAASAVRSTVPALPGSRTLASSTTSRGDTAVSRCSGTSMNRHTASRPCGVTVCASSAITWPLTASTGTPCAAACDVSSSCRDRASAVTNSSVMSGPEPAAPSAPGRPRAPSAPAGPDAPRGPSPGRGATWPQASASRTACGPSARNSRVRCRDDRRASCRAAFTRGDRMLVTSSLAITAPVPGPVAAPDRTPPHPGADFHDRGRSPAYSAGQLPRSWNVAGFAGSGGLGVRLVAGQRLPCHLDQCGERGRVGDRELGEHPPVDVHGRDLQPLDEPVVGHAVGPGRGVDALDPQPPERALAVLAVAVRVDHRVELLLLGLAIQAGPLATVAACPLEDDPALLVSVNRPLHACHFFDSFKRAGLLAQQFLDPLGIGRRERHLVLEAPGPRARLVLEVVGAIGPAAHDLAGAGKPEALAGPGV